MRYRFFIKAATICMLTFLSGCKNSDGINYSPIDFYSAPVEFDDSGASRRLRVAAVSLQPSKYDKDKTLADMKEIVLKIKRDYPNVQVIVFGETILGWYYDSDGKAGYQQKIAETIPGRSTDFISDIAIENKVNIIFGLAEKDTVNTKMYNSQVLLRENGELIKYRKMIPGGKDTDNNYLAGDELSVFNICGFKAVMIVCSDMQSESLAANVAAIKPDVIFHSLATTTGEWDNDINVIGREFNTWIVFANRFGNEGNSDYNGFSCIIDPVGKIRGRCTGKNSYVYREIGVY